MENTFNTKLDGVPYKIRSLFEAYGYQKYQMAKFEAYDLYSKHRNFLDSQNILTFTDARGKLLALKPDVTVGIVNNTNPNQTRKLFYVENVFRIEKGSKEFKEINQIGVEYIGGDASYAEAEVVLLALKSLAVINDEFILTIGHIGFISAFFDYLKLNEADRKALIAVIKNKNPHETASKAAALGVSAENVERLLNILSVSGNFAEAISQAEQFAANKEMRSILKELKALSKVFDGADFGECVRLDFSVINDMDYYNGLLFQGYIPQLAKVLLSGGRYDNLMRRFDKPQQAVGFAIYTGELERAFHVEKKFDVDVALVYGDAPLYKVTKAVSKLIDDGYSVCAEKEVSAEVKAKKKVFLNEKGEIVNA